MTPYEMEEQLKTLDVRTRAIEQFLPTLATKEGLEEVKRHAVMLNEATRGEIRLVAEHMATPSDLREVKSDLNELRGDLNHVRGDLNDLRGDVKGLAHDVRRIAEQVAILSTDRPPKKKRRT